jgi:hypothetical protein
MSELSPDEPSIATAGTARTGELKVALIRSPSVDASSIVGASGEPRQKLRRRKVSTHLHRTPNGRSSALRSSDGRSKNGTCRRDRQRRQIPAPRVSGTSQSSSTRLNPNRLRSLVATAIENHLPKQQFTILKAAEESEREIIRQLVGDALNGGRSVPWGRPC